MSLYFTIINFNKIFICIFFLLILIYFSESLYEYIKRKRYNTVLKRKNQWKLDVKNSKDFKIIGKLESWNRRGDEERCAGRLRNLRFPGALCFYFLAETPTLSFSHNPYRGNPRDGWEITSTRSHHRHWCWFRLSSIFLLSLPEPGFFNHSHYRIFHFP